MRVVLLTLVLAGCSTTGPLYTNMDIIQHDMEVCREMGGDPYIMWGLLNQYVMCNIPLPLARDR